MHRFLPFLLVLIVGFAGQAYADWPPRARGPEYVPPTAPQMPHPAVARIIVPERGGISYGSGTLVDVRDSYGLVVTNWHVIRDWAAESGDLEVVFSDGFRSFARAVKADREWDLAALVIWRPPGIEPVRLASQPPRPGDNLTIAGYGQGRYRAVTGRCIKYLAPAVNRPAEMVEVSVQARQGDSGGPIFNDRGELAGVLWGASFGTTSGSYNARVQTFLASLVPGIDGRESATQIAASPHDAVRPSVNASSGAWTAADAETTPAPLKNERDHSASVAAREALQDVPSRQVAVLKDALPDSVSNVEIPPFASPNLFPSSRASNGPADATTIPTASIGSASTSSAPAEASDDAAALHALTWRDVAGETFWDQAKSLLAIVGVFALLFVFFRLIGD